MASNQSLVLRSTGRFSVLAHKDDKGTYTSSNQSTNKKTTPTPTPIKNVSSKGQAAPKQEKKKAKKSTPNSGNKDTTKTQKTECEWTPSLQSDHDRIYSVGEECISSEELKSLLLAKHASAPEHAKYAEYRFYDGFEPSGRMHIAQGVFKAMNVNKCTSSGGTFVFWVADWFALMNDKMGGDLEKIKIVGHYLIEVWKAAGMNIDTEKQNVIFKWASEEITNKAAEYWPTMLDVARRFNVTRIKKCCQIMGRLEGGLTAAQILYPLMQCTDVFFLRADVCQLGVDQRKVNMLAREYCDYVPKIKRKPVILSHHMLFGLKAGQEKMSKSDPDSAVFMEDTAEDVRRKIMAAYCPTTADSATASEAKEEEEDAGKVSMHLVEDDLKNPCLDYIQNIILCPPDSTFTAGGDTYSSFEQVKAAFLGGKISETELKEGLIEELNKLLEPVRHHFTTNERAKDLFAKVLQFKKESSSSIKSEFRKLDLVKSGRIPSDKQRHVVFAPLPNSQPTLQSAMDTLDQIKAAGDDGKAVILYLSDWSAMVQNACDADVKPIQAFYDVFVCCLKTLGVESGVMENVTVVKQSEAILSDPSNYWISVINVGRHFRLDEVMGKAMKDADGVGKVIARLMRVADILALSPSSIAFPPGCTDAQVEMSLIKNYTSLPAVLAACGEDASPTLMEASTTSLKLQMRESEAHKTENDEYYLMDDPKVHGKSKMKKAFCEPGNVSYCPPISVTSAFLFSNAGSLTIHRSEENGGNITYKSRTEVENDFASGALHPGDLKAEATTLMVNILGKLVDAIKKDSNASKAAKALKAFQKKMAKKSKGGKK